MLDARAAGRIARLESLLAIVQTIATAPSHSFVIDASVNPATSTGNVYPAFNQAFAAALRASNGRREVTFRANALTIDAGVYDIGSDPISFFGPGDLDATLTIKNGASLVFGNEGPDITFANMLVEWQGATGSPPFITASSDALFNLYNCEIHSTTGQVPFLRATGTAFVDIVTELGGTAGGRLVLEATDDAVLEWQFQPNSHVGGNTLSQVGPGAVISINVNSACGQLTLIQSGMPGGFLVLGSTYFLGSNPAQIGYHPAVPGNWAAPVPTNIASAIDRMAALLRTLSGAPIP